MEKTEGIAAIQDLVKDGESRTYIKNYLVEEGVPGSTAYRWINEIHPQEQQARIGDRALNILQDLLDRAEAEENFEAMERLAIQLVNASKKLGRA